MTHGTIEVLHGHWPVGQDSSDLGVPSIPVLSCELGRLFEGIVGV